MHKSTFVAILIATIVAVVSISTADASSRCRNFANPTLCERLKSCAWCGAENKTGGHCIDTTEEFCCDNTVCQNSTQDRCCKGDEYPWAGHYDGKCIAPGLQCCANAWSGPFGCDGQCCHTGGAQGSISCCEKRKGQVCMGYMCCRPTRCSDGSNCCTGYCTADGKCQMPPPPP